MKQITKFMLDLFLHPTHQKNVNFHTDQIKVDVKEHFNEKIDTLTPQ